MTCHTSPSITICCPNIYKFPFNGTEYFFEWHYWCGPIPVHKRTLDPRKTVPTGFYKMINEWIKLSKKEQKKYLIYS